MRYAQTLGQPHKGQRLHVVGTIGKKLSKLVLYFTSSFSYPGARIKYTGTTNFAIILSFTLDVNLPASQADRLFLIAFEAQ